MWIFSLNRDNVSGSVYAHVKAAKHIAAQASKWGFFIYKQQCLTYITQSIAMISPMSADGIPTTFKTIFWTLIGLEAGIGGEANVAMDADKLKEFKFLS